MVPKSQIVSDESLATIIYLSYHLDKPMVVITSNRTRDIHIALKRRCLYHWIDYPDLEKEVQILQTRVADIEESLANRTSRRLKYSIRGAKIDIRRILRKNMQYGGELLFLDFKKKKRKKHRIIFLGDVSGSMDIHTLMILQFIHALRQIDRRTEIFFFSTEISRKTRQFDTGDFAAAMADLPESVVDWGGGTRIGHCLQRFKDYQPICQGMSTALPYIDGFLPMSKPEDLKILGRTLPTLSN